MKSNILFKKGEKVDNSFYDEKSNVLSFDKIDSGTIYLTFDSYFPSSLNINVLSSNISIICNYLGNIEKCECTINVDKDSKVNLLSIFVDNEKHVKSYKTINNYGSYQSMQIDLCDVNLDNEENINMLGDDSYAMIIDGMYATNKSSKQYQTNLNHIAKDSISSAQVFAINNDEAHVSIYTDAYIKRGAIGSKTHQIGRIINLSSKCNGIVLPNLHIDENDVEASHSCSVGSVNKDHVYYMQTRGLNEIQAKNALIRGYFNPILKSIDDETIIDELSKVIDRRIG